MIGTQPQFNNTLAGGFVNQGLVNPGLVNTGFVNPGLANSGVIGGYPGVASTNQFLYNPGFLGGCCPGGSYGPQGVNGYNNGCPWWLCPLLGLLLLLALIAGLVAAFTNQKKRHHHRRSDKQDDDENDEEAEEVETRTTTRTTNPRHLYYRA